MEDETPSSLLRDYISEYLSKHPDLVPTSEKISVLILLIGIILNFLEIKNTDIVLITGSILTAITYCLATLQSVDTGDLETTGILNSLGLINFIYKLYYISLVITALVTLVFVINFPLIDVMIKISVIALTIVLIISVITKINDRSKIYNSVFYVRIVPAILLLIYLVTIQYNPRQTAGEYYSSGIVKYKHWDLAGALADFNNEIKINPGNAKAYYYRGRTKLSLFDNGAIADFNKAIEINPDYAEAYLERGKLKYNDGDYAGAITDLTRAEINADVWFPYEERADAKYHLGDYSGAIEDYDKGHLSASRFINEGNAKLKLGDTTGAIEDLSKAIEAGPGSSADVSKIYCDIANLKINTGDYNGAKMDFWRIIQLEPGNAEAYYGRGTAEYKLGNKSGACLDWRKAGELGSKEASDAIKKYCK